MKYFLTILLFFVLFTSYGQVDTDSLKRIWHNTDLPDSIRIKSINMLAWDGFLFTQPDSSYYYAQLQYDLAKKRGWEKEMAVARNTQGTSFYMVGNYAKAIDFFYRSLTIKEDINDYKGIAATLNNIGMIYDDQGDHEKAISHYLRAIENIEKLTVKGEQDNQILVASYHNLGALYLNMDDHKKALEYFEQTLDLTSESTFLRERAYTYSNMGHLFLEQDDLEKSREYFSTAFDILKNIGDENGMIDALNNFGYLYVRQEDFQEAITYANNALQRAKKNNSIVQIRNAAETLYKSHKQLGNFQKSLAMHELYSSTRDSLKNEENKEAVLQQEYKYTYEKQATADSIAFAAQQEIQNLKIAEQQIQLESEKNQRILLYSMLALLAILFFVGYRGYKKQNEANRIITSQKLKVEKQRDKIAKQHALLEEKSKNIVEFNNNLESLVAQRTSELENSLRQIHNYQFNLAHNVRAPFVTLVGLLNLIRDERFDSNDNQRVLQKLHDTSKRITFVLQEISHELNKFDATIEKNNPPSKKS